MLYHCARAPLLTAPSPCAAPALAHTGQDVMSMLNSTIFDCLIFRGYGNRVAARSHVPGDPLVGPGFQLDLGLKDVTVRSCLQPEAWTLGLESAHPDSGPQDSPEP